ncbi:hypothetical protein BO221_11225 [Archangium sp. Cb G35]|uniref:hypothetical protein n=1 Tax=Archangium sp. Cb G35 TaxID=1920190 RepID=UPI000937EBDA|nr:hypothetical protein [Archangium sp. Cb G35]OJT24955.1 hypothetical protein BO221_11225 [Archangium sp. Cb G35]
MAAWFCIGVLGLAQQARADDEEWEGWDTERLEALCGDGDGEEDGDDDDDGGDGDDGEPCTLSNVERRQLVDDIYEYSYRVRVGPGAYDLITLHRVVREHGQWSPVRTQKSMFLVHGDALGFRGAFLSSAASPAVPTSQSIAVFLARRGVDVWGIDLRWVHVPSGTTDFSFMKGWNLGMHAKDVGIGLGLARGWRSFTGNGNGRMVLLGWSRGATISYAYLNGETQQPLDKRHVSGFIPVDMAYTFAPGATQERQAACQTHAALAQVQASGQYEGGMLGLTMQGIAGLAIHQPAAPSSLLPGSTNRQVALLFGAATHAFQTPPVIPNYHWTGGQFSAEGLPTGLSWTAAPFFFDTLAQASPYQSIGEQVDTFAMWCGAPAVPYDDHLAWVRVPVLYVGAAGGMGGYGLHSLSLLGSTDVSSLVVQRFPDMYRAVDYGHADLFLAADAQNAVWTPILDWVQRR